MKKNAQLRYFRPMMLLFIILVMAAACTPKSELDKAQEKWDAQKITHYRMKVRHMQSIWHLQTYEIEVTGGEILHSATCIPAPSEGRTCEIEDYDPAEYTVDGLFETARWQLESEYAEWVKIKYDAKYGYPESILFDHPEILDEDNFWAVLEFEQLP